MIFENFYDAIIDGFEATPKDDMEIRLPNGVITLKHKKVFGVVN